MLDNSQRRAVIIERMETNDTGEPYNCPRFLPGVIVQNLKQEGWFLADHGCITKVKRKRLELRKSKKGGNSESDFQRGRRYAAKEHWKL